MGRPAKWVRVSAMQSGCERAAETSTELGLPRHSGGAVQRGRDPAGVRAKPARMRPMDSGASSRFPWWVVAGAALLAAGYLPTLATPFDFVDDGNLVYPTPQPTFAAHVSLWWEKVRANYEHLGPFRPTLWVHWQLAANLLDGDALAWRIYRLIWCGLAAGMLLWLLRELGVHPVAALLAGALA